MEVNIEHWIRVEKELIPFEKDLIRLRNKYDEEHKVKGIEVAAQKTLVTAKEYERLEDELRLIAIKSESAEQRAHVYVNLRWWIAQVIRANYRRLAYAKGNNPILPQ